MTDGNPDGANETLPTDPNALVQHVLRESYLQTTEDLRYYAEKVRYFNQQKKVVRDYVQALREFAANARTATREAGIDPCSADAGDAGFVAKTLEERSRPYPLDTTARELCIPDRIPRAGITSIGALEAEIARWEAKLNSIGDDSQLANVDLQNILQKQQQTLQMLSNISKMLHDTATSVIRKIGG